MFGEEGWCRSCGTPLHAQCGNLVLQRKGLSRCEGSWQPNWQSDTICMEVSVAERVASQFKVELREIDWHGTPPGRAMQIVFPSVGGQWFDPEELRERTVARHGVPGATCTDCGTWRWSP